MSEFVAAHSANLLVLAWFLFMATSAAWVPAYNGDVGNDRWRLIAVYLIVAVVGAISLRARVRTRRDALVSSLPALGLLAAAALVAFVVDGLSADGRGSPLYRYFAVALWASWAVLVLLTASLSRASWKRGPFVVTLVVALLGFIMATVQFD